MSIALLITSFTFHYVSIKSDSPAPDPDTAP